MVVGRTHESISETNLVEKIDFVLNVKYNYMKKLIVCLVLFSMLAMPAIALMRELTTANDVLAQYTFTLEGIDYQLPTPLTALYENGWSHTSPGGTTDDRRLDPNTYGSGTLYKGEESLSASFCNATDEERPIAECVLVEMTVDRNSSFDFSMGNGLMIGSDVKQLAEVYNLTEDELSKLEGKTFLWLDFIQAEEESVMDVANTAKPGENTYYFSFSLPYGEDGAVIDRISMKLFPK